MLFRSSVDGIFAAGNVLHVHDLVDFVSLEAEKLADSAAGYLADNGLPACDILIKTDSHIGHTVPQRISGASDVVISMRVRSVIKDGRIVIKQGGVELASKKMKKLLPAEMIRIPLKASAVKSREELEVCVEC